MSIGAVGGLTAAATAVHALGQRPQSAEVRGAPEHERNADGSGANAATRTTAVASANAKLAPGRIDVKA
jgi:hypothetical protein